MDSHTFSNSDSANFTDLLNTSLVSIEGVHDSTPLSLQATAHQTLETEPPTRLERSYDSNLWVNGFLIVPILGWFLLIASVLTTFFKSNKSAQTSVLQRSSLSKVDLKQKQLIPCARCRYFSPSSLLHCAVRPSDVLTTEAIDCSDYVASTLKKVEDAKDH
jgi:hypothetical protein